MYRSSDYAIACICPMGVELAPVRAMLDQEHPPRPAQGEQNTYRLGTMAGHNVVIAVMPEIGTNAAAKVATQLLNDFPSVRFGLLVGIGGGVPKLDDDDDIDIRLGDVVVSKPTGASSGVVQYDLGKYSTGGGFEPTGALNKPPAILRSAVEQLAADHKMKGSKVPGYLSDMFQRYPAMREEYSCPGVVNDNLYRADYPHQGGRTCRKCDSQQLVGRSERPDNKPRFHYGTIGSANVVVKDAVLRDELQRTMKVICLEMEAAGMVDSFPCLVIRGICDYADSHKNKMWQPYAAATAAAYMKELLSFLPQIDLADVDPAVKEVQPRKYDRGLNLFDAPEIDEQMFIGREDELEHLDGLFMPNDKSPNRKVVGLVGMGGVGKTQLAIAYAKRRRKAYTSIFWFNAASEEKLQNSFNHVARRIATTGPIDTSSNSNDEQCRTLVLNWLSELDNSNWLLIFDNYDNPELFDISQQYPYVSHGAILVTTRLSSSTIGNQVSVRPFSDIEKGIDVLRTRSSREITPNDLGARRLVERLDGYPLALVTAGSYIRKQTLSFEEYLLAYENHWNLDPKRSLDLRDYQDRTLYTTWNVSYARLQKEDQDAANMLKLLAHFDNQNIWYGLFHAGASSAANHTLPQWLVDATSSSLNFGNLMGQLVDYCFVEVQYTTGLYNIHACVHDWIVSELSIQPDETGYWFAFECIASLAETDDQSQLARLEYANLVPHAMRLIQGHSSKHQYLADMTSSRADGAARISKLLEKHTRLSSAAAILEQVLELKEKVWDAEIVSVLDTVRCLGCIYYKQRREEDAEKMLARSLAGFEKELGPDDTNTLINVRNLATVYAAQGYLDKAETMYRRALAGFQRFEGPYAYLTLATTIRFGIFEAKRNNFDEAVKMYLRVLDAREVVGSDHDIVLRAHACLGAVYAMQGKLSEAEDIYLQALSSNAELYGPESYKVLTTGEALAYIYCKQQRFDEAERLLTKSIVGLERLFGASHVETLKATSDLGNVYYRQGSFAKAEELFDGALIGREKVYGIMDSRTLRSLRRLADAYSKQGKADELGHLRQRACDWGYVPSWFEEMIRESQHRSTSVSDSHDFMYPFRDRPRA